MSSPDSSPFQAEQHSPLNPTLEDHPVHVRAVNSLRVMDVVTHCFFGPQVTEQSYIASIEDERESSQLYDFAQSIFQDCCKNAVSLPDLDTAIDLFRQALDRRPALHPLRSDSLKDLARALVTRFSLTNQLQDLNQAIFLLDELMQELDDSRVRVVSVKCQIWIYHLHSKTPPPITTTASCSVQMMTRKLPS